MPPLAVAIPVISRSEESKHGGIANSKGSKQRAAKSRLYGEGPLPTKPSETSPKQARIVCRNEDKYDLKIGDVDIKNVGIEDILDYVSPLDLERFENHQFVEERSVLSFLEADKARRKREKLERQKERAKTKGVVIFEEADSTEEMTEGGEVAVGKHGRARPTYTHLFKRPNQPRMRKRHADSDEIISTGEDENEGMSTENEPEHVSTTRPSVAHAELPKRRRRKRDKLTGELLPLSPAKLKTEETERTGESKRQRRKRHPLTGELMPIGWRYDPEKEANPYEMRRSEPASHSFRQLSISEQPLVKRQRLDLQSSVSRSPSPFPTKAELAARHTPRKAALESRRSPQQQRSVEVDLISSDEESSAGSTAPTPSNLKTLPKPATGIQRMGRQASATESSSVQESSSESVGRTSGLQPSTAKSQSIRRVESGKTSILNPSFSKASSTEPLEGDGSSEDEDLDEAEWFIESILDHQWSDPTTHPAEFGNKPVMLYLVKWEGYDDPTYEPIESFGDRSTVTAYRREVGLDSESSEDEDETMLAATSTDRRTQLKTGKGKTPLKQDESDKSEEEGGDDMEEDEFEVEKVLDHHLSDPRTHPKELGRTPVVLYKVKWKGWPVENSTWEPPSSFEDQSVLEAYHRRIGR